MTKKRRRFLYGAYIILIALVFSYLLFPSDSVKEYLTNRVYTQNPAYRMDIETLRPSFPPSLRLKNIQLFYQNGLIFNTDVLKLFPNWLSLFTFKPGASFQGEAYQGRLNGALSIIRVETESHPLLSVTFTDINLMLVPWFQEQFELDVSGTLSGKIRYEQKTVSTRVGAMSADIADCIVNLTNPIFDLGQLEFDHIKLVTALNNDTLEIQQGVFTGHQMTGSLSGSILMQNPSKNSRLKLNIKVKPDRVFLSNLSGMFSAFFSSAQKENEEMTINISGTIGKPQVSF